MTRKWLSSFVLFCRVTLFYCREHISLSCFGIHYNAFTIFHISCLLIQNLMIHTDHIIMIQQKFFTKDPFRSSVLLSIILNLFCHCLPEMQDFSFILAKLRRLVGCFFVLVLFFFFNLFSGITWINSLFPSSTAQKALHLSDTTVRIYLCPTKDTHTLLCVGRPVQCEELF